MKSPRIDGSTPNDPTDTIARVLDETKNGRMVVLIDDRGTGRGCLMAPAQMVTPQIVNQMATHARGLVCLALLPKRIRDLGLELMPRSQGAGRAERFTASIEARTGVTTGISAADRSLTIAAAIDVAKGAENIVTPGHVFPIIVENGGLLDRMGFPEAAIDIVRLAGLNVSAVICEMMNKDGDTVTAVDAQQFAYEHGVETITLRRLLRHRIRNDHSMAFVAERRFEMAAFGTWRARLAQNRIDGSEYLVLLKGEIDRTRDVKVTIHMVEPFKDLLNEVSSETSMLRDKIALVADRGAGVIIVLGHQGEGVLKKIFASRRLGAGTDDMDPGETEKTATDCARLLSALGLSDADIVEVAEPLAAAIQALK